MYIYFEDWSQKIWLNSLTSTGRVHDGKLIKVLTLPVDPRIKTGNRNLRVFEVDGSNTFCNEIFEYDNRGFFLGEDIEAKLNKVNTLNLQSIRSLFRFATNSKLDTVSVAMSLKTLENRWLIDHPLEVVDGLKDALLNPSIRSLKAHLDLFSPPTIKKLSKVVNFDEGSTEVLDLMSGARMRIEVLQELNRNLSLERK